MVAQLDADVTAALRAGDETVFARLVLVWSPTLVSTAMALTGDSASADSVVRATWLSLPAALDEYQPPPGLRAWVCGLLLGQLGLGDVVAEATDDAAGPGPAVEQSRFLPPTHPQWPGHWAVPPTAWPATEDAGRATLAVRHALRSELDRLPTPQRVVVSLRDVAGCEVAEIAGIVRQPPQRVRDLLNHGRAALRRRLELDCAEDRPA